MSGGVFVDTGSLSCDRGWNGWMPFRLRRHELNARSEQAMSEEAGRHPGP
jgi:hypothetical protein